jgi:hypothetical protein
MAQAVAVELVIGHFADALGRERDPVQRHLTGPPASGRAGEPARGAAADQEAVVPRMPLERHRQRGELGEQLTPPLPRERLHDPDVDEPSGVVVEAEQERAQ